MNFVEAFADLNPPTQPYESMETEKIRDILSTKFNWSFLHNSAINIIDRNSLDTIDILNLLNVYRFLHPADIVSIAKYITALDIVLLNDLKVPDNLQSFCDKNDVLVTRDKNGVDYDVYIGLHKIKPEALLQVDLGGKSVNFHYLLPYNYEYLKNPDFMSTFPWDYYALFNRYMLFCIDSGASDIHFDIAHFEKIPAYRAFVRIGPDRHICDLFKITSEMNRNLIKTVVTERSSNKGAAQDLDSNRGVVVTIKDVFGDGRLDVRFEANPVLGGYLCVCRLQEQKTISLTIDELGFDEQSVKLLRDNTERPSGLTVFTGKIRTGKNTTMNAVANEIVQKPQNYSMLSLDDPIEILGKFPQVDYKGDVSALRSYIRLAKKQDLDFLMLNEIPNSEVAFGVRDSVNSSIHVMTTWHQNRIWHLPHKLFEYFGESYRDVLSQINLICNQRLYKKQCPHCLEEVHRNSYTRDIRLHNFFTTHDLYSSLVSKGCSQCGNTGRTRNTLVVLPEILKFDNDLISELFEADRPFQMEKVLFKKIFGSHFSLEIQLKYALLDGRLSPIDILSIV